MKFLPLIAATAVLSQGASALRKLSSSEQQQLLSQAVPVVGQGHRQTQALSISVNESIQFNTCITLTTELSSNMQQTLVNYQSLMKSWDAGGIVSLKDYILFNVCNTTSCVNNAHDNLYMTDLKTYMALTSYRPQVTIDYCTACNNAQQWCQYHNQTGRRFLETIGYVNCATCESMGCYLQSSNSNAITIEHIVQWAQGWTQCTATGYQDTNGLSLYASFMCNAEGTGVELGVFLDNDCNTYTNATSFVELFPSDSYLENSRAVVTYPFVNDINCKESTTWESPEYYTNATSSASSSAASPNQYCQTLAASSSLLPINNCNYAGGQSQTSSSSSSSSYFSGDVYDLSQNDLNNEYAACVVIHNLESVAGSYHNAALAKNKYSSNTGNVYNYNKSQSKAGMSGVGIFCLTLFVVALAGAVGFYAYIKNGSVRQVVNGAIDKVKNLQGTCNNNKTDSLIEGEYVDAGATDVPRPAVV